MPEVTLTSGGTRRLLSIKRRILGKVGTLDDSLTRYNVDHQETAEKAKDAKEKFMPYIELLERVVVSKSLFLSDAEVLLLVHYPEQKKALSELVTASFGFPAPDDGPDFDLKVRQCDDARHGIRNQVNGLMGDLREASGILELSLRRGTQTGPDGRT